MNDNVQSDLATLAFNKGVILILQQVIIVSGETVSSTRLLFQYIKPFSKSEKLKSLFATNIIDLITFLENNSKYDVCIGGNMHGIYSYL